MYLSYLLLLKECKKKFKTKILKCSVYDMLRLFHVCVAMVCFGGIRLIFTSWMFFLCFGRVGFDFQHIFRYDVRLRGGVFGNESNAILTT